MRHRVAGRKLGRTSEHRLALLRNLSTALFDKERITTTLGKAKELRPFAERLVTLAKRDTLHARRQVLRHVQDRSVVAKLFDTLSPRYAERPGGYTRIFKLGPRRGDHAEMAVVELVGSEPAAAEEPSAASKSTKRGRKKKTAPAAEAKSVKRAAKKTKKKAKKKAAAKGAKQEAKPKKKATKKKAAKKKTAKRKAKRASDKG